MPFTRREFLLTSGAAAGAAALPRGLAQSADAAKAPGAVTVGAVIDRIYAQVGVPLRPTTVDNLLVGSRAMPVRGIATTMMATFDVCKRAQTAGANFIITHETPFYLHQDKIDDIRDNAVLKAKQAFLEQHGMAILHFHDEIHDMHPDGVAKGMLEQLGWEGKATGPDLKHLRFNGVTLAALSEEMATKLGARAMRVVGDPELAVHNVQTIWGYCSREGGIAILSDPAVDVLICGETREWELVEYVQDAVTAGQKKGLVLAGHVLSEQGGMIWATKWLRGFVPEVPVTFVPAMEPFWLPGHPVAV